MSLSLMFITNQPRVACIAQDAGVDRVWVDLESIGKEDRQPGMNTVKSSHKIEDVAVLRKVLTTSKLQVRVNPVHEGMADYPDSKEEIDAVIQAGADIVMLPMFKTVEEVEKFVLYVNGRARVTLLLETREAVENIDAILTVPGIDEMYIGLNDLHLSYGKKFMFEPLCDGKVDYLARKFQQNQLPFGFGGIARIGYGLLPAEYIITEHYRLGSTLAILSRSFCNIATVENPEDVRTDFIQGVANIRAKEAECSSLTEADFRLNHEEVVRRVTAIVSNVSVK